METLQVEIINPKAGKLLTDLADLNLIVIRDISNKKKSAIKKVPSATLADSSDKQIKTNEIYPFKPQYLKFDGFNYILREKLIGAVSYEEGHYTISNDLLDITVWGQTRDEAEDAFAFSFHSLYKNFAKEADKNLTPQAILLKQTLKHLVVNIIK